MVSRTTLAGPRSLWTSIISNSFNILSHHIIARRQSRIFFQHLFYSCRLVVLTILSLTAAFMVPVVYATVPVGATPGSFAASPSGAATYTIPIAIPPGTHAMQPNVSLTYNSQTGNGLLGMGWSLGSLSVIHRCGATKIIDGFKGGVNYDANDKFCLDGERLISIGNNEYRTSHESWQRVVASDSTTNPASFTVYERDGTIHSYGVTPDSRIAASPPNTSIVRLWALNQVQDRNGNYFTITYTQNNAIGEYYPTSIAYTGNGSVAPYNFVYFDYQSRTDVVPYYEAGSLIETTQRLSDIRSCTNTTCTGLVRRYNLSYDNNGAVGRSRLTSVQECGTDGVCLPSTNLTWTPAPSALVGNSWNTGIGASTYCGFGLQSADINGDGRGDLVWQDASSYVYTALALSGTSGFGPATNSGNLFQYNSYSVTPPCQFSMGDINGDGLIDLSSLKASLTATSPYFAYNGGIFNALGTSAGLGANTYSGQYTTWLFIGLSYPSIPSVVTSLADIDGDGRADFLVLDGAGPVSPPYYYFNYYLSTGNGFGSKVSSGWMTVGIAPGDFNGDGRSDVLCIQPGGYFNYALSTGTTFGPCNSTGLSGQPTAGPWPADINGDGKSDIVWIQNNSIYYAFSTGAGFTMAVNSLVSVVPVAASNVTLADINGDGLPDVVWMGNDGYIHYSLANGNGFGPAVNSNVTASISSGPWAVDYNGDGKSDLVWIYNGTIYSSLAQGGPTDLLQSVTDGLGVQTSVSYKPLTDSTVYAKDNSSVYPYQDVQNATYVVSSYTQSNGINGTNTTTATYGGLKRHLTANTSLGFRWMQVIDPPAPGQTQGLVHITYFNQTLDGTEGTVASSETWASGVRVKDVSNTWTPVSLGTGRTLAQLSSSVEETRELNNSVVTTVTTSNSYDGYENPLSVTVTYAVGGVSDGWQKTTTNTFNNDTTNWQLGQLLQSQVTAVAPGQTAQTRTSSFTYDALGRLASEVIEPNSATLKLTTVYGYNAFGNRVKKTISGSDIPTRDEYTRQYDARGQFVAWQTNALTQKTTFDSYDLRNGAVTHLTDPNNLITQWIYNDGFGRLTQETRPDNTNTTYTYSACDGTCPSLARTMTAIATTGAGTTWIYRDMLGREVRRQSLGFGGKWVYQDTGYDDLGRIASVSRPYYSGATVYYTTSGYDALNRLKTVTEPGSAGSCNSPGRTTVTSPSGLTTTVTNPKCQQKTTVKNSQGQVVSSTDAAGTTYYQYDPFGNLVQVTGVDGAITSMTYDIRGRKRTMHDPDMGNWSYTYDALGELTSQKDAKNLTINMTYDALGRMKTRALPNGEGTGTWTYDTAAYGIGKLASVSNPNTTETYTYDNYGRLSTDTTSIGGVAYTVTTTYDAYSRVALLVYPETGFTLNHLYDDPYSGMLQEVRNRITHTSLWKINTNGVDALNRITNELYGNGQISQRQYDPATGDLLSIKTGTTTSPTSVQNLGYSFDALGNLVTRTDTIQNFTETFHYDEDGLGLNRLTSVSGPAPKTYAYYPNGNIQSKSNVGTYTYPTSGTLPHAVASVAGAVNASYSYDANGNMFSGNGRTITYTSFNKPATIAGPGATDTLIYDANFNRIIKSNSSGTTVYLGKLYERVTSGSSVTQKHYLYAGNLLVGAYSKLSNGTTNTRYFHTDHLGSVDTITSDSATGLAVSVTTVPALRGSSINIAWSGIATPTATDWVGVYTPGSADTAYLDWAYTNGSSAGTLALTLNQVQAGGTYEIRLYAADGYTMLAKSASFIVNPTGPVVAVTGPAALGASLNVAWSGIATPTATDWVGVYVPGTNDYAYLDWTYTNGSSAGTLALTLNQVQAGGTYEIRLYAADGYTMLAKSASFIVNSQSSTVAQRLSYDAFGKRRNVNGTDATSIIAQTTRGFTRQEHDDEVGLINMNAREYDYVLGRFISPDTIIPGALNLQSYNRYSYVNNNPLSYTDPTGHGCRFCDWLDRSVRKYGRDVAAAVAAYYTWGYVAWGTGDAVAAGAAAGATYGGIAGGNLKSAAYGGVTGGAFGAVGDLTADQPWYVKTGAHGLTGGVTNSMAGGDFRSGFVSAGFAEFASPVVNYFPDAASRVVAAGLIGGEAARLAGGNFNDGFLTAAFARLFNDELHGDAYSTFNGGGTSAYDSSNGWIDPNHPEAGPKPSGLFALHVFENGQAAWVDVTSIDKIYIPAVGGLPGEAFGNLSLDVLTHFAWPEHFGISCVEPVCSAFLPRQPEAPLIVSPGLFSSH